MAFTVSIPSTDILSINSAIKHSILTDKADTMSTVADIFTDDNDSDFYMMLNEEADLDALNDENRNPEYLLDIIVPAYEEHEAYQAPIRLQQAKEAELALRFARNSQQRAFLAELTSETTPEGHQSGVVRTMTLQQFCKTAPIADDTTDWQAILSSSDNEAKALLEQAKAEQEAYKQALARMKQAKELAKAALARAQATKQAAPVIITDEIAATIAKIRELATQDDQAIAKALDSGILRYGASKTTATRTTSANSGATDSKARGEGLKSKYRDLIYAGIRAGKNDSLISREVSALTGDQVSSKVVYHARTDYLAEQGTPRQPRSIA